jgi:uncharacterized membrane protein YphA (DoxX/SURF4 family)
MDTRLLGPATALRYAIGLMATLAGLDKFFGVLADWGAYVSPVAAQALPIPVDAFMAVVGVIEVVVGLAILTSLPVLGAYVASAWLVLIAGNLVLGGYLDIAVRDLVLALAAFTAARLAEVRQQPARAGA